MEILKKNFFRQEFAICNNSLKKTPSQYKKVNIMSTHPFDMFLRVVRVLESFLMVLCKLYKGKKYAKVSIKLHTTSFHKIKVKI